MEPPSIAVQAFRSWGAQVEPLPTSTKEECDWLVSLEECRLIAEEKTKFEDALSIEHRLKTLRGGGVHGQTLPLRSNNRLSGIVRKAVGQLSSTSADVQHDLRVLWFTGTGFDGEAKHYQLMSTLYGSTRVFELNGDGHHRTCYFFRNSDFYRFRNVLDGAYVTYLNGNTLTVKLCLNPYSSKWKSLRDSPFAARLKNGLIDPFGEEGEGAAYVIDGEVDRSNPGAVIRYLEEKYGLKQAMNIDMGMTSASILVPRE
ncbi:hypothetical protein [Ramlibacter pallidus]|uniref:Uncharacterized protein n=1 Tax=Ramlibacter pallidus TaxID=2780087 RepID=A0ABR9RYA7_9BURK|nr:hypothetical protein [Ramlibacter pallidus]MBE7366209.1 hypothetical protein [Ramlibacter pallidus]